MEFLRCYLVFGYSQTPRFVNSFGRIKLSETRRLFFFFFSYKPTCHTVFIILSINIYLLLRADSLVRLHTNVNRSLRKLEPFIFREWKFDNSRTLILHSEMSAADQAEFYVDPSNIDWKTYMNILAKGVRKYLHNENEETLKKAMRKQSV